ncbi:FAD-dependent oxidoreductase [Nocardioides daphniae]|uniref:NAD(P)/FAD-dependent oxidoreductase n=1 Tax=Nocardioides daphniae TaxID=402297 RepID=A0A4P7UBS4_9ACTN|nr:FAD-dependent oxidoreductase [Nocardioides daphniae]QCC77632.1 NAD(P)/FAD-dependent oxidoreductase [Nocardioides daphniae]
MSASAQSSDQPWDAVVIGAGQAGLSAAHHLRRRGVPTLVLDGNDAPGGAWQHRWDSLRMDGVHGVADLPGAPAPPRGPQRANEVLPAWFAAYEAEQGIEVVRPVRVTRVESEGELLRVRADDRSWLTRTLVNATGTWERPFVPTYPGQETFSGEQLHASGYRGAEAFRGRRVVVVGGGASAVQLLGEIAPVTDTLWVTRREPVWAGDTDEFDGTAIVRAVEERVVAGLPPASVVSVTGLRLRPQEQAAAARGAYERHPMFVRVEPDGVRMPDGTFEPADVILWATGFRPDVSHLAPLGLRSPLGGITLLPGPNGPQSATTAAADPRVQLVGYGPSASTIGGNRGGLAAAIAIVKHLRSAHPAGSGSPAGVA